MSVRIRARSSGDHVARNRWLLHLSLMIGFLAAIVSAIFLSRSYFGYSGTTDHSIIGVLVLVLVMAHLLQRRRTVHLLLSRLRHRTRATPRLLRQAQSDTVLWLLMLNATVSGVADFLTGHTVFLPIPGPYFFQKWHALSVLALLGYVITHVIRRRNRLRHSHVR